MVREACRCPAFRLADLAFPLLLVANKRDDHANDLVLAVTNARHPPTLNTLTLTHGPDRDGASAEHNSSDLAGAKARASPEPDEGFSVLRADVARVLRKGVYHERPDELS